jgi:hypothetical protein
VIPIEKKREEENAQISLTYSDKQTETLGVNFTNILSQNSNVLDAQHKIMKFHFA